MTKLRSRVVFALTLVAIVALELVAVAGWKGWFRALPDASFSQLQADRKPGTAALAAAAGSLRNAPAQPVVQPVAIAAKTTAAKPEDSYYQQLRGKIRWVETRLGKGTGLTPDLNSRMLLVKSAAQRAGLEHVGLGFADVYGLISAETSWVPRTGMGKNGTASHGIAQFEPATARALGLRDPNDLVEAVHVAAEHMKEAAIWSEDRIDGLKLGSAERAAKLREGVSIYYNLSSRGRRVWNGKNTSRLPVETRRHILNTRIGAQKASLLAADLRARQSGRGDAQTTVASVASMGQGGS